MHENFFILIIQEYNKYNYAMMRMALFSTLAIEMHNIPEGIAVLVPIYFATGNKKKAFFYSSLSGLAEPVGALVGYLILMPLSLYGLISGMGVMAINLLLFI